MSTTSPSKYAENQFLVATAKSFHLMSELLVDTLSRTTTAAGADPSFTAVLNNLILSSDTWDTGEAAITNAEAAQLSATLVFEDHMASLTRKPDANTNSLIETWDATIRSQVPYQGGIYTILLPHGRETITAGTLEERLDAVRAFGLRLANYPALVALGTTVSTYYGTARALRTAQSDAKSTLEIARATQEANRVAAAASLYAVIGQGMVTWSTTPERVDTLWDVNILRNPPQTLPEPPADTTWTPATRQLSTTALPTAATRLEAWRLGPGAMPERLHTGSMGETAITIPANITFTPGGLYQLWLVALNSKGPSAPGPVQNWTAP